MPIINQGIAFTSQSLALIAQKKIDPEFNHTKWSEEDLRTLRAEIRDYYRRIQRLVCVYCQEPVGVRAAEAAPVEHIVPKSQYLDFIFEPKNLCVTCADCNHFKGSNEVMFEPVIRGPRRKRYPTVSTAFQIVHPHFDDYDQHIIKANRIYVDRTPKGHYTIGICKLNRFFQFFGTCDEFINDAALVEANDLFFSTGTVEVGSFVNPDTDQ